VAGCVCGSRSRRFRSGPASFFTPGLALAAALVVAFVAVFRRRYATLKYLGWAVDTALLWYAAFTLLSVFRSPDFDGLNDTQGRPRSWCWARVSRSPESRLPWPLVTPVPPNVSPHLKRHGQVVVKQPGAIGLRRVGRQRDVNRTGFRGNGAAWIRGCLRAGASRPLSRSRRCHKTLLRGRQAPRAADVVGLVAYLAQQECRLVLGHVTCADRAPA
jgi:hypothetical protein